MNAVSGWPAPFILSPKYARAPCNHERALCALTMDTIKRVGTYLVSQFQAFCARSFSGKVVLAALVVGLVVGGWLF